MVIRNYDMGGGESLETATDIGETDIIEVVPSDAPRSSRHNPSEPSGTVRQGRFQYLGDRPFELTDNLKGYNKGSSTDAIYRTSGDSSDWWQDKKRGWHTLRWLLVLLALLLVVGLIIYFLMIDMKMMTPILTKSQEGQQLIHQFERVVTEPPNNDVVALDGDVILDLGGITYHDGQYHVTNQPTPTVAVTAKPINTSHQDFIEIVPAPDLGISTQSDTSDMYKELLTLGTNTPHSSGISTTRNPSDISVQQTKDFLSTFDDGLFFPSSKLYNKPAVQQNKQTNNDTEFAAALPLIRKGNRINNKITENESSKNRVTASARSPVYPTLPSSTSVLRNFSEILHHNESESLCFSPHLTMCRGTLPYDLTTLPLVPGISKLADLDAALPYFELIVESGCSARARQFVCSILEPECRPEGDTLPPPCHKACKAVAEECGDFILATLDLSQIFQCELYPDTDDPTKCVNWARGDTCMANEFRCPDGTCIPTRWKCDGVNDCSYAADETNCTQCRNEEFRCDGDKCISLSWQCDGQQDCSDGSDEVNCHPQEGHHHLTGMPHTSPCPVGELRCLDGRCITLQQLCDGKKDCSDGADEVNCSSNA